MYGIYEGVTVVLKYFKTKLCIDLLDMVIPYINHKTPVLL